MLIATIVRILVRLVRRATDDRPAGGDTAGDPGRPGRARRRRRR